MKFVIINKDSLVNIPPLLSVVYILLDEGHSVHMLTCGINDSVRKSLENRNVTIEVADFTKARNSIEKLIEYYKFRCYIYKKIKQIDYDYLWIEGGNTVVALGDNLKKFPFYLQVSELYESNKYTLYAIRQVIKYARKVFMPEYNRSFLYKCWFNLSHRPIVLPNKPYFLPTKENLLIYEHKHSALVNLFNSHKVMLYQGHIFPDRDLSAFIHAVDELADDFIVVLMGKDYNMVEKYKKISKKVYHVEFIPVPEYLLFTSKSYIGILGYNPSSLNNSFCAPNKLFEYSAYGKPMLGNDIPGLRCIEESGAGEIIDENNPDSIINAIKKIDKNYEIYSNKSRNFFEKVDNVETIRKALQQ